jgi:hypothetical protein
MEFYFMEFEEILLEEIITIVKEAKDENFMRIDLKCILNQRLEEHEKIVLEESGHYTPEEYADSIDASYREGYDDGWDDAREEIQELATNMKKPR